jgi:hypothetical protein
MLKKFWSRWMQFGRWLGDFFARLLLTLFYFTIALPFGLLVSLAQDPLDIKKNQAKWVERKTGDRTLGEARRMF